MLTVARPVVEINARFRDVDAPRFVVKDYPKYKEYRRVKLSTEIATLLREHIQTNGLGRADLLFAMPAPEPAPDTAEANNTPPPDLAQLGRTDPNKDGRTYSTAQSPPTTSAGAAAGTAATPAPATAPPAERTTKTTGATVASAGRSTPTGTSPPLVRPTHLDTRRHRRRPRLHRPRA
jgi:hypothetical protein